MDGWMISFTLNPHERYAAYHYCINPCTYKFRVLFLKELRASSRPVVA
jgi:hypothetical protein